MIPIANPRAYAANKRFIDRNLNRRLYPKEIPEQYEDHLDPVICEALAEADIVLDLHSYASQGGPFIFLGPANPKEQAYARALGVNDFVYGWQDAYGQTNNRDAMLESMGTTEYTRTKGGIAITLECGHHHNENNADVGYQAIINALSHFDMTNQTSQNKTTTDQRCIRMKHVFYKEQEGEFTHPWKHYDFVKAGQPLAKYPNGETLTAPEDSFIVLPKVDSEVGTEWFYLGVKSDFPV